MKDLSINKKLYLGIAFIALINVFVFYVSVKQTKRVQFSTQQVDNTNRILAHLHHIENSVLQNQTDVRGFVITNDSSFLNSKNFTEKILQSEYSELNGLMTVKHQRILLDSLKNFIDTRIQYSNKLVTLRAQSGFTAATAIIETGVGIKINNNIKRLCSQLSNSENSLLDERKSKNLNTIWQLNMLLYIVLSITFLTSIIFIFRFITFLKQIKSNEDKFRALLDAAPDATVIADEFGIIKLINLETEKLFGYTKEELIGHPVEMLIPVALREKHIQSRENYMKDSHVRNMGIDMELTGINKDQTIFPVEVSLSPIKTDDGLLVSASIRDITQRKASQAQLEFFSSQIDRSNDAIYVLDANLNITNWNHGAEKLYGYSKEDVIGKNLNEILRTYLSEDEIIQYKKKVAEDGHMLIELKRKTKSGNDIWVQASSTIVKDANGAILGYSIVNLDITIQKKLTEELNFLAKMVEQSSEAFFSRGRDMKFLSWNEGAEKLFGYSKEDAIGKTALDLGIIALTWDQIISVEKQIVELGSWKSVMDFKRKDGSSFIGSVIGNCINDEAGDLQYFYFIVEDITLRKQFEEKLKQSNIELEAKVNERTKELEKNEKRFRTLIENSNDVILLVDEKLNIIYRSPSSIRIVGWTDEDMIGKNAMINMHPDDFTANLENLKFVMNNPGKLVQVSFRNKHKDGTYRWLEGIGVNLLDNENVHAIVFDYRDVTEKRDAEEKLLASEKHFRALFDQSADGIFLSDANGIYLDVNLVGHTMLGYTHDEIVGMHLTDILYKEDIDRLPGTLKNLEEGNLDKDEWRFVRKDGSTFIGEVIGRQLPDGRLQGILRDVTERKKQVEKLIASENRFRTSLDTMLEGVQIIGFDWKYIYVNDAFTKHAKYKKEELIGKTVMEKYPGIEQTEIFKTYQQCFNERTTSHLENEFEFPDKSIGWFELSFLPVPEGIFILSVDITERKNAQRELVKANEELEDRVMRRTEQLKKTNEELDAFTFSVSHDLRAPLRGIVGFTTILEEDYINEMPDEAKRITNVIKNNAVQMGQLIDDLLNFSRIGKHELNKIEINTQSLVNEIIDDFKLVNATNKKIQWEIRNLMPAAADVNTIRQVWINLISNAIKYSGKQDQPTIEIGSYLKDNHIVFYVKDNGVGFDQSYAHKLFKVFQRLHSTDEFEGTGVGLALVEKIVSKHGGNVWAEATFGKGACFSFSLPI